MGTAGTANQGQVPSLPQIFKVRRYPFNYPAFTGRDLTPGNPIEGFQMPHAVADDDLSASRLGRLAGRTTNW